MVDGATTIALIPPQGVFRNRSGSLFCFLLRQATLGSSKVLSECWGREKRESETAENREFAAKKLLSSPRTDGQSFWAKWFMRRIYLLLLNEFEYKCWKIKMSESTDRQRKQEQSKTNKQTSRQTDRQTDGGKNNLTLGLFVRICDWNNRNGNAKSAYKMEMRLRTGECDWECKSKRKCCQVEHKMHLPNWISAAK